MNPENTIKCLIPQPIIENIPSGRREMAAGMIVHYFREANPELFDRLSILDSLTDDVKDKCVEKIRLAALEAHKHQIDSANNNNPASE